MESMKGSYYTKTLALFFIVFSIIYVTVESRNLSGGGGGGDATDQSGAAVFNILSYGAKGDGISDDSDAVLDAWDAACKVSNTTLLIPSDHKFLVNLVKLKGPCKSNFTLQVYIYLYVYI